MLLDSRKKKGRTPKDVKDLGNARLVPPEYRNWIRSDQWSTMKNVYDIYINEEQVHGQIRQIDPATVRKNANSTVAKPMRAPPERCCGWMQMANSGAPM